MNAITRSVIGLAALSVLQVLACGKDASGPPPPDTTVATIAVSPARDTLVTLGDTLRYSAVARNAAGAALDVDVTWSAEPAGVVTVDATGLVTAVAAGATAVRATTQEVTGTAEAVVRQRPVSIDIHAGDGQGGAIGAPLDSTVAVAVRDAGGSPIPDLDVSFVASAGGAADPAIAVTDADGIAVTRWTMGSDIGPQELQATPARAQAPLSAMLVAYAHAGFPAVVELVDGDAQSELAGRALPAPLRVQVFDDAGNPIPDVSVFLTAQGGGTIEPAEAFTNLDGVAEATWTLGADAGSQRAVARVFRVDPSTADSTEVTGSPVAFDAAAVDFDVVATSSEVVAGDLMTIEGSGFDPVPSGNTVEIDGRAAAVLEGTQTTLTVRVPTFGCEPAALREIVVRREVLADSIATDVGGEATLDLAVGEYAIRSDPSQSCLQFAAGAAGDLYLVGLTGTRPLNGTLPFVLTASDGTDAMPFAASTVVQSAAFVAGVQDAFDADGDNSEAALRAYERGLLERRPRPASVAARDVSTAANTAHIAPQDGQAVVRVATTADEVGTTLQLRVPKLATDPCNEYTAIDATVIAVTPHLVIASDPDLASPVLADIEPAVVGLTDVFATIHDRATAYLGEPAPIGADGRVTVVLTPAAGESGLAAFSSAVDLVERATCSASDERELIYVHVSDAPTLAELQALLTESGPALAHELAHVLQSSRRLQAALTSVPAWLSEGVAELLVEIIGHTLRGASVGANFNGDVLAADALAAAWYAPRFDRLAMLYGWDGVGSRVTGAPGLCSLFGFGGPTLPCARGFASGAAWSFVRYLGDRIGALYPGGEAELYQTLMGLPDAELPGTLESLANVDLEELIVHWAIMLYADDRVADGAPTELEMQSWDLQSIESTRPPEMRLAPTELGFGASRIEASVVGGGTAYFTVTADAAHGALAIDVRDPAGNAISGELWPRLWVVRMR